MAIELSASADRLRQELIVRNRRYAAGRLHVESYGGFPVIVYAPEEGRHGNFFDGAYAAIEARPEWMRRFDKVHAQGRSLPKSGRRWRELDSSMSSDALLMNVFCTPAAFESVALRKMLGVDEARLPAFGVKARVPLASGRFDRTEVDMQWGNLLAEAKLTEADFQVCEQRVVQAYRDFDEVFERERLPAVQLPVGRRKLETEFPEDYSQQETFGEPEEQRVLQMVPREWVSGYASYQLIRNVLAAHAQGASFCVFHDGRRPDLREAWFRVMTAVRSAEMRMRLKVLTWQELAGTVPEALQVFLEKKYGIVAPGRTPSEPIEIL
ncbi:MAG: hypothetical protein WBF42_14820 [Terracidiphilus sp.]